MMKKRRIKFIAMILLAAFIISFGLPTQQIAHAKQLEQTLQKQTVSNINSNPKAKTETRLNSFSDELYTWYEKLKTDLDSGDLDQLKSDIKEARTALKDIRKDIDNELAENEKTLQKLNAKNAIDRHQNFKTELDSKLDGFETLFEKLDEISAALKDLKGNDTADLRVKIEEIGNILKPEQPQQPLGSLPHNDVSVTPPAPVTGTGVSAAYMGSTADTTASNLPKTPTSDDLAVTAEVKFTKEVKDLADSLNTPVAMYEYVRNNVNFEPYYGSRKGSEGTRQQMSGNDFDQASLLIAMLRYKGIPARYVRGTVEIPIEKIKSWTGAETPEAAVKTLGSLGIPSLAVVSGGGISGVEIEHVWVEAYVPFENYRGIGAGSGQKIWVPLDPSYKQYEHKQGLDIESITGISKESLTSSLFNSGDKSSDNLTVTNVDTSDLDTKISEANTKLNNFITENSLQNAKLEDIIGGLTIKQENLGLLPLSLPYKTITVTGELTSIPNDLTDGVTFAIKGSDPFGLNFSGTNDFNYNITASELFGKKVTLSWTPASSEDESIINQYGGIFNTPAYLIQVKPQLKIDNEVVATGNAVGLGYRQDFIMTMHSAGMPDENITNPVTAGAYYSVGFDYQAVSSNELTEIANKLKQVQPSITESNIYNDEAIGEMLNGIAKSYFAQLDFVDKILAEEYKVKSTRLLSEAITGYNVKTSYLFMAPVGISEGGFFIDVDHDVVGVSSRTGQANDERAYMTAAGMLGSAMEHGIYEQALQTPSVSTIKILQEANSRGVPIYTINKENISTALSELEVSQQVKSDIQNAVNSGRIVTIPKSNIQYFDWNGTGYIVADPSSGAAAYMISGGIAGGSTSILVDLASAVNLVIGVIMLIDSVAMLLAATTLIGTLITFSLYALTVYYLSEVLGQMYSYYVMGDYNSGQELIGEAILGLVALIAVPVLGKIFEALGIDVGAITARVLKWFDDIDNAIVTKLLDLGCTRDFIIEVAKKRGIKGLEAVAEAISKVKTVADDFLNYVSGKVVRLRDGIGFRPAVAGVGDSEELLTVLNNSEISNISKIESIAGAAGRYLSIDEVASDIAATVKKVKFRGTVLDMMDESGNVLRRVVVPEGYRSTQQLLYKAFSGEVDVTIWGYTNASKMEEVVNNIYRYLNRSDLSSAPSLINSKYAGKVIDFGDGIVVEFDPLGFPIFKGAALKADISILGDATVLQKGLSNMTSQEHMRAATRKLCSTMQEQANIAGKTLEEYLGSKGFNSTQITQIKNGSPDIDDFIWHHNQETGRMQLVDETTHSTVRHNGGNSLWGEGFGD